MHPSSSLFVCQMMAKVQRAAVIQCVSVGDSRYNRANFAVGWSRLFARTKTEKKARSNSRGMISLRRTGNTLTTEKSHF